MKKLLLAFCLFFTVQSGFSQAQPSALIWGVSPFQDSLWAMDTLTWLPVINVEPLVTNSVITGLNGLAFDPTTYKTYAIAKIDVNSRHLLEINLATGASTMIGDLGDKFSSITFDKFGQLWGATGDGATNPETLYKIDKATATTTLVFAMGNGNDGEVICYNRFDNKMYHWSGNGTVVFESWPLASTSYTPGNITVTGITGNETFGALSLKATDFIISNISSEFRHVSSTGNYGNGLSSNPDDLRGLVMPPRFSVGPSTVCVRSGSVQVFSNCLQEFDSLYCYWGDGNVTQLPATSAVTAAVSHTYLTAGNYTVNLMLYNGAVAKSTIRTYTIAVNTTPSVTISGPTNLCPGTTLTLTGAGGGTSQWYKGGLAVPGATLSTLTVTTAGWYNMIKTNQSGCSDSAAVGKLVTLAPGATVTVAGGTVCNGSSFTLTPSGAATYTFSGGSAIVSPSTTTSYSVSGTSTAGCVSGTVVATVSVLALPVLSVSSTQSDVCLGEAVTLTASGASTYVWSNSSTASSLALTPTATAVYSVTGTGTNGCAATATISQVVSACVGINENSSRAINVRVSPNPSSGRFVVENTTEGNIVEVYNALGKVVFKAAASQGHTGIDISSQSSGVYFVRISDRNKVISQNKLIKE